MIVWVVGGLGGGLVSPHPVELSFPTLRSSGSSTAGNCVDDDYFAGASTERILISRNVAVVTHVAMPSGLDNSISP